MDYGNIYCNYKDIKIKSIINQFMRYLSLYVFEYYNQENGYQDSLCDIFIISKYHNANYVNIKDETKSIVILTDGYDIDVDINTRKIYYKNMDIENFLSKLLYEMEPIFKKQKLIEQRLIYSDSDYMSIIYKIIKEYAKYEIFENSLYMKYYPTDKTIFERISKYKKFVQELEDFNSAQKSNLIEYAILHAMYEIDIFCKKNSYEILYSTRTILNRCENLLHKYECNEELRLLRADIYNELEEFGSKAINEYISGFLVYISYAYYKMSICYKKYIKNIDSAEISILNILKNDCGKYNYKAWYQYAKCLSYKNDIQNEAEALCNVLKIFKEKWEEKILSPLEYKYLENIVLELEDISNKRLIYIDEKDLKEMKKLLDRDLTSEFKKCMGVK